MWYWRWTLWNNWFFKYIYNHKGHALNFKTRDQGRFNWFEGMVRDKCFWAIGSGVSKVWSREGVSAT